MNWDKRERPTNPQRDLFHQHGMMMAEIRDLRAKNDELEGRVIILEHQVERVLPRMRASIRAPAVQTSGIAFAVSSTLVVIFETIRALGFLK